MGTRDETIKQIRAALKRRSGKAWSVTGGTGTAWGWITIDAPPARRTWRHVLKTGGVEGNMPDYEERDTGQPHGHTSPAERAELARLLGLESIHHQGLSIPSSSDYYREHVERAETGTCTVHSRPYWD